MGPHLDFGDVIYHNQWADLMQLIEQVQYKAALILSGCWQRTSCERLYDELGWENPSDRQWARRMTTFYKIKYELAPSYLSEHLLEQSVNITTPFSRIEMYDNSLFSYCIENWNKLENSVKILPSLTCFKKHLNSFIRPKGKSFYAINGNSGFKLSKIRVQFSDLRDHRYTHNFNCKIPNLLVWFGR